MPSWMSRSRNTTMRPEPVLLLVLMGLVGCTSTRVARPAPAPYNPPVLRPAPIACNLPAVPMGYPAVPMGRQGAPATRVSMQRSRSMASGRVKTPARTEMKRPAPTFRSGTVPCLQQPCSVHQERPVPTPPCIKVMQHGGRTVKFPPVPLCTDGT